MSKKLQRFECKLLIYNSIEIFKQTNFENNSTSNVFFLVDEMDATSGSFYSNGGMPLQTLNESNNPFVVMIGNMESKVHSCINALYGEIDKMKALLEVINYCLDLLSTVNN